MSSVLFAVYDLRVVRLWAVEFLNLSHTCVLRICEPSPLLCRKRLVSTYRACTAPLCRSRCSLQRALVSCAWKLQQRMGTDLPACPPPRCRLPKRPLSCPAKRPELPKCPLPCLRLCPGPCPLPLLRSLLAGWLPGWRLQMALRSLERHSNLLQGT